MLFGIVVSNYTSAHTRRTRYPSGRPISDTTGNLPVYFGHYPEPQFDLNDALEWMIPEAPKRGFRILEDGLQRWREPGYIDRIRALCEQHDVQITTHWGGHWLARDPKDRQSVDDFLAFALGVLKPLDITVVGTVGGTPHNRWTEDPPLNEQVDIISERLGETVRAAAGEGITIAIENHTDYRSGDLLRILSKVNQPNLKIKLDTGNTMNVIEDPVEAARALAPHVVSAHIKDVRVIPFRPGGATIHGAPLGMGYVDVKTITQILQEQAPDPKNLHYILEVGFLNPSDDSYLWVEESIRWAKENLSEYFS